MHHSQIYARVGVGLRLVFGFRNPASTQSIALALKLATDSGRLGAIRERLGRNRTTYPLFDTERFTGHLKAAYTTMWQRYQNREAPKPFAVDPIASTELFQTESITARFGGA
jgi:hypothetical protein